MPYKMVLKSLDLRLCLFMWSLLTLKVPFLTATDKLKLRNGETGRYIYYTDSQEDKMYCRYCPRDLDGLFESEDVNERYQVRSCVDKNVPILDKLDQEEIQNQLYPVCNTGEIPSCARPLNPESGFWKCKISDNPEKVLVYTACQLECDPGYKAVGEESIYCNESRKFEPSWTETTCINALALAGSPFLAVYVSVSSTVGILICVVVSIICCRRKYRQQCDNTLSRKESGFKCNPLNDESVQDGATVTREPLENKNLKQNSEKGQLIFPEEDAKADFDTASNKPLLHKQPSEIYNVNQLSLSKNATEHEDQQTMTVEETTLQTASLAK